MDDSQGKEASAPREGGLRRVLGAGASRRTAIKAAGGGALSVMGAGALAGRLGTGSASASQQATPAANPEATPDASSQPNILVIMGDDIGYWNISAYSLGMMGYRTPN